MLIKHPSTAVRWDGVDSKGGCRLWEGKPEEGAGSGRGSQRRVRALGGEEEVPLCVSLPCLQSRDSVR